jgi:hypothetical protein
MTACRNSRHDFVVVETIDFFREEENELPPAMALKEVVALNKAAPYEGDDEDAEEDGAQANGRPRDMQVRCSAAAALRLAGEASSVAPNIDSGWRALLCGPLAFGPGQYQLLSSPHQASALPCACLADTVDVLAITFTNQRTFRTE